MMTRYGATPGVAAVILSLMVITASPGLAADQPLQLTRPSLRPGDTMSLKPGGPLDATKKVFVRLTGRTQLDDLVIDAGQMSRGVIRVVLPKPMRQGRYDVEIVNEAGDVLARGARLKILATETPVITKVVPHPSYAQRGAYSFELLGEHFGQEAEDNDVRINDLPIHFEKVVTVRGRPSVVDDCQSQFPCLVKNRGRLQVFGLSLDKQRFYRPMTVSVQVDNRATSSDHPLLLSWAGRGTPAIIAFATLALLAGAVYWIAYEKARRYPPLGTRYSTLAYFFIEPDTNTYSLSRLQLILWTAAAVVAYVYLAASQSLVQWKWQLAEVPEGLPTLIGLSVGTTALAIGATGARGSKGAGPSHPGLGDFITTGGILAPERLQFLLWTVIGVFGFVSATLAQDPATLNQLPKVPDNFLPLMGVSAGGYLAGKMLRKPGPVIKQLTPRPPFTAAGVPADGIQITGENLSPRAQVSVNGVPIAPGGVVVPPSQPPAAEFVTDLIVTAPALAAALAAPAPAPAPAGPAGAPPAAAPAAAAAPTAPAVVGVAAIKIVNPDGQTAEV